MISRTTKVIAAEIQMGDNTHHHDHVIFPRSFRIINTMVNSPVNPIPPVLELLVFSDIRLSKMKLSVSMTNLFVAFPAHAAAVL